MYYLFDLLQLFADVVPKTAGKIVLTVVSVLLICAWAPSSGLIFPARINSLARAHGKMRVEKPRTTSLYFTDSDPIRL